MGFNTDVYLLVHKHILLYTYRPTAIFPRISVFCLHEIGYNLYFFILDSRSAKPRHKFKAWINCSRFILHIVHHQFLNQQTSKKHASKVKRKPAVK